MAKPAHLFAVPEATAGGTAAISYWLDGPAHRVRLEIRDRTAHAVATLPAQNARGINHASWNTRMLPSGVDAREAREEAFKLPMPLVLPGTYTVALLVDGRELSQPLQVRDDPRLRMTAAQRSAWTDAQVRLWRIAMGAEEQHTKAVALAEQAQRLPGSDMRTWAARLRAIAASIEEVDEHSEELLKKIAASTTAVAAADSRRIDAYGASLSRHEADVSGIQQNMRAAKR